MRRPVDDARGAAAGEGGHRPPATAVRLLWFALLWIAGVAVVGAVAWLIRSALGV